MSIYLNKSGYFTGNRPFGELPSLQESELDRKLLAINEERENLEKGILLPFDPTKLGGLVPILKEILEKFQAGEGDFEIHWSDLLAIDDAIRSYLPVAKKIIESFENKNEAKQIRRILKEIGEIAVPTIPKCNGIVSELSKKYKPHTEPVNPLFPLREQMAEHRKEQILGKARALISFAKGFQIWPKVDLAKQAGLQRDANRLRVESRAIEASLVAEESPASNTLFGKWINAAPLPVDAKLLAHLLGDVFAENSGFEGYKSNGVRKFIGEALQLRKSLADEKAPYEKILGQFLRAARFERAFDKGPEALMETFERELLGLEKNETVAFEGGWTGVKSGHAIVLEARRQENGLFSFRFYNGGDGLQYHENVVFQDQLYHLPFLEVSDIHPREIVSLPFCKALHTMAQTDPPYGQWRGVEAYEGLIGHLKGKVQRIDATREKMSKTLSVGFCSYLSWAHWMKEFAPDLFERWEIELQAKTFSDFVKQGNVPDEQTTRLIRKCSEQLARNSLSAFEKGIIDEEEWELIQGVIGTSFMPDPVSFDWIGGLASAPFGKNVEIPKLTAFSEKKPQGGGRELDLLVLDRHPFNPSSFLKETYYWRERFAVANQNQNYEIVREAILEWIERVPFEKVGALVEVLKPDQAAELLHQLSEIGKDYLFSGLMREKSNQNEPVLPRESLALIKLLTVGHAISSAFDGRGGLLIPHLYQRNMNLILEGKSGSQHLFNPQLEADLLYLRDYWRKVEPIEERGNLSFFGFEYIPAACIDSAQRSVYNTEEDENKYRTGTKIDWHDLKWMKEYIQKPEIQQQLALDPDLADKTPNIQALLLMYQSGIKSRSILPQAFKDLHDLSFCIDFAMDSPYLITYEETDRIPPDREKGISFECTPKYSGKKNVLWHKEGTIFGRRVRSNLHSIASSSAHDGAINLREHNYALTLTQDSLDPKRAPIFETHTRMRQAGLSENEGKSNYRNRLPAAERVVEFPGPSTCIHRPEFYRTLGIEMPLQPMRELLALSAQPSLQIRETFAYYQKNPQLLENREGQVLFKKLFFEPPLLIEFAKKHPEELNKFIAQFDQFCQNGIQFYTDLGSPLVAAFYIEISDQFRRTFPSVGPTRASEQIRDLIGRQLHTPEQELFLFLDLILMQTEDHLTEERTADLLEAVVRLQTIHWPKKFIKGKIRGDGWELRDGELLNPDYPHEKEALAKNHLIRLRGPLEQLLQGDRADRILNDLLTRINPNFRPLKWEANPQFPYFSTVDGSVVLELFHGQIYQKGSSIKPLPRKLREHPDLRSFINSNESVLAFELEPNTFEFSSKTGEKMRVFCDENDKVVVHKLIDGSWAQKIQPFHSLPKPLQERGEYWLTIDQSKTFWIGNQFKAQVKGSSLGQLQRLDTGWVLGDAETPASNLFHRIEDADQILPWLENGKIKAIELPRLGLTFDVDADGNATTRLFDGYRIAHKQTIPGLAHLSNYLVLEKKKKNLILMPAYQREAKRRDILKIDAPFKREKDTPLIVFDVDKQRRAVPKSGAARFYLSYLFLTEQRYDDAWDLLVGTDSEIRPLDPLEKKILGWMSSERSDQIVQDPDPRAIALRLKAELLLIRDQEHYFSSEKLEVSDTHYAHLLQKMDQVPPRFFPTPEEEARLNRYLSKSNSPQILSRRGHSHPLTGSRSEEQDKADQDAIGQLTQIDRAYSLFGKPASFEESKEKEKKVDADFSLRARYWNDRALVLAAYECARHPKRENLAKFYGYFFPGKPLKADGEMAKEIHESYSLIARSESHPFERAVSALICGVMDHPNDFPPLSDLKDALDQEQELRRGFIYGRALVPFAKFADKALAAPIQRCCLPYLQRAKYPPFQFLKKEQRHSNLSLWEAPQARLSQQETPDVDLKPFFDVELQSPFEAANKQLIETFWSDENMVEQLQDFAKSKKSQTKRHILKGDHLLQNLMNDSKRIATAAREREQELQQELLSLANRLDVDSIHRLKQVNDYLSDQQRPIEMPELFKFFLTLDTKSLAERNPALQSAECQVIFEKVQEFLIVATQRQHLQRLRKMCSEARKVQGAERERLIQKIATEGGQKRAYPPHRYPDFLLIEYGNQIRLREVQVKAIEEFEPGTAQEMIMGSGKTMVFLPLLAMRAADGKTLSMIVMPDELLPSMAESLEKTFGKGFGHSIDVLQFHRDTPMDSARLERVYERLQHAIEKRRVIAMSGSGLQSLFLMAVDAIAKNKPEAAPYRKILALMKKSGNLILDEMHMLLDVLQAHHFSDGDKQPLSTIEMEGAVRLLQILISEGWDGKKPIAPEIYHEEVKGKLIDRLIEAKEFSRLSKEALKYYLLEKNSEQAEIYVGRIPSKSLRSTLATLKEQVNRVLPLVLGNEIDVHFGMVPDGASHKGESRRTAIPYHGSQNPVLGSQFGSDLETIDYTLILHLVKGIDTEIVEKEISAIKEKVVRELEELKTRDIRQTPSFQRFVDLAGSDNYPLFTLKPHEIEEIRQKINQSGNFKLELIRAWILPELRTYPRQLFTNGHIFPLLVSTIRGFSGTNWNSRTFPKAFKKHDTSDTQPYTLHLLQSQDAPLVIAKDAASLLQQIGHQSLADRGAVLRSMKNRDVAHAMLQKSNAKGVVYYEGDKMKVAVRTQSDPIDYSACPFDKSELLAYWDQKHNTGSDIPLNAEAKAIATIGRHTHLYELLQCVWRLRSLHQGQRVRFAILEEEAAYIQDKLHRETGRPLNQPLEARDFFLYCWLKERNRGRDHSVRALGFKCMSELIEPVLARLFDESQPLPPREFFEALFYSDKGDDLFERYGRISRFLPKEEAVKIQIEKILSKPILKDYPPEIQAKIRKDIERIAQEELPHLPEIIASPPADYENQMEIDTQTEQEQEKEVEQETQVNQEVDRFYYDKQYATRSVVSWEGPLSREHFLPSPAHALASVALPANQKCTVDLFRDLWKLTPVVSVQDALYHFKFPLPLDSNLLASATFMPLQNEGPKVYPFIPFGKHQDIVQETLLIEDVKTGRIRMMLITQDEAKQFEKRLAEDRASMENGVRLALYHIDYGLYGQGPGFASEEILHANANFLKLKVQAKFYNGDVHYSKEEIPALEHWIEELRRTQKLDDVIQFFEREVLKFKEKSKSDYPRSILYRMLHRQK